MHRKTGLFGAVLLIVAACSSSATPVPTAAPTTTPTAAPTATVKPTPKDVGSLKLALGTAPVDPNLSYFYLAKDQGYYTQNGLQLQIDPYNGDPTANRALIAGQADILLTGCGSALQAIDQGAALKIISAFAPSVNYMLVGINAITRPKEFEGKNLGVSGPGAVSYTVPLLMIQGDGGDTTKVTVVSVGGTSARAQALVAKKIDGTVINTTQLSIIKPYDYLHVVADAFKAIPDYLYTCEVTTQKIYTTRLDALQAFVTATAQAVRWFYQDANSLAKSLQIMQAVLPDVKAQDLTDGLTLYKDTHFWNEKGTLTQKAFDYTIKAAKAAGDIKGNLSYSDIIDTQLTLNAQKQ